MIKHIRKIAIGVGFAAGISILLLAGFIFFLKTDYAQQFIQTKINEKIPGTLLFGKAKFSLLKGELELKNVLIKSPSGIELAGFDRLYIDILWLQLVKGSLTVDELLLEKPWAIFKMELNGDINLLSAFYSRPEKEKTMSKKTKTVDLPINIVVRSFKLVNGSVEYAVEKNNLRAAVNGINMVCDANLLKQSGKINIQINKVNINRGKVKNRLNQFFLDATLKDGKLAPVLVQTDANFFKLKLSGYVNGLFKKPLMDLGLDLEVSLSDIRKIFNIQQKLSGTVKSHITAKGTFNAPEIACQIDYMGGILWDQKVDKVDLNLHLKDQILFLNHLLANIASGALTAEGEANLQKAFKNGLFSSKKDLDAISYGLNLKHKGLRLEELLGNKHDVTGTVCFNINLAGKRISYDKLTAEVSLNAEALDVTTRKLSEAVDLNIDANAVYDDNIATIHKFELKSGNTNLSVNGQYNLLSKEFASVLKLYTPDLSKPLSCLGIKGVAGSLFVDANVSGSAKKPVAGLKLNGKKLFFQDVTIGDVELFANLDKAGNLKIQSLNLENKGSVIHGMGSFAILKDSYGIDFKSPLNMTLNFHGVEAKNFVSKKTAQGTVNGNIEVESRINNLKAKLNLHGKNIEVKTFRAGNFDLNGSFTEGSVTKPKGTLQFLCKDFDFSGQKIQQITLSSKIDGDKIHLSPLKIIVAKDEFIECNGLVSIDKTYQFVLKSKGVSLHNIYEIDKLNNIKGKMMIDISGHGTFTDPEIKGSIAVKNLKIMDKPMDDAIFYLDFHNQIARISGNLNFNINGTYDLQKKDFTASALFTDTKLGPYFKLANQTDLSGTLSGILELSGNLAAKDKIKGSVDISLFNLYLKNEKLAETQKVKGILENEIISIPNMQVSILKTGYIALNGKMKLNGPVSFNIEGNIPLEALSPFAKDFPDIHGNVLISANLKGTQSSPDFHAEISMENIGFTILDLSQQIKNLNGKILFTQKKVDVDYIKGQLDTGSFYMDGQIELDNMQPSDVCINLSTKALPVRLTDMMNILINTNLKFKGKKDKSLLQGDIIILSGTYYKDVNVSLFKMASEKKREVQPAPPDIDLPFLRNMRFDVFVKRRNPFWIDNNIAHLGINPDLHITGNMKNPVISGRAQIKEGKIFFNKNTFVVKKGVIDFLNPYKIDPVIEIKSFTKKREWLITLDVSGTMDQLKITFSSEPFLEQGDILSILLFGKTTKELVEGEGKNSSQSTEQMVAKLIASTFGEDIKNMAGLDIFEIETQDPDDPSNSDRIKVTLGKKLSKRMVLKYAFESKGGEMVQQAVSEYKLLEHMLVKGFQDSKGILGGELLFIINFR